MSENQNVPSWDVSMSTYQQEISYELPKDSGYCLPTSIGIRLFQLGLLGKAAFWLLEQKVLEQKPLPMLCNCPFGLGAKMSLNYFFIL